MGFSYELFYLNTETESLGEVQGFGRYECRAMVLIWCDRMRWSVMTCFEDKPQQIPNNTTVPMPSHSPKTHPKRPKRPLVKMPYPPQ